MAAVDPTLQARLEDGDGGTAASPASGRGPDGQDPAADPAGLLLALEAAGRFHRDRGLGRIFHPRQVSFRESVAVDSLHVIVDGDRVAAHVDRVSPLGPDAGRAPAYSLRRAVAHNVVGMGQDLYRLLRGRQGDHRCELKCERVTGGPPDPAPGVLDAEDSSWSVQLEVAVAGSLDPDRLRGALARATGAPPAAGVLEVVDSPDDGHLGRARDRLHRRAVPAAGRPPLAAVLARRPAGDVLMVNLCHAAGDAPAGLAVLHAVAGAYASGPAAGPAGSPGPAGALDFLAARQLPFRPAPPPRSRLVRAYRRALEHLRDTLSRPAALTAQEPDEQPGYGFHLVTVPLEEVAPPAQDGRRAPPRAVLMAALHLALGEWHRRHGGPGRRVGVLGTVDLRPRAWPRATIGNLSVTARVSTTPRQRAAPERALRAVNAQSRLNTRARTGIALVAALERAGMLPLWASQSAIVLQPVTHNRFVDAGVLCDLGPVEPPSFGAGAGDTVGLWCSTPARSPLALCVGAVSAGARLHLAFRYPHHLFGAAAAARFAACYLEQLRRLAGTGEPDRPGAR